MDPVSRRQVWEIISEAKKGRVVILTTHSMEEADVLSDRIGIGKAQKKKKSTNLIYSCSCSWTAEVFRNKHFVEE
jgi:ABC-type multidrug transport system ATPase subunit